jgi:3-hydroxyisobutyrate dehydrogenase-like beta-hydroxyacid dehydrogenase
MGGLVAMIDNLTMIGFGEAGRSLVEGWRTVLPALRVQSYDIRVDDPAMQAAWREASVEGSASPAWALADAEVVFCLVTADQALAAARAGAPHLLPGALWLDGNSCSPGTKKRAAEAINGAGGRYVDLAIMSPILPKRHKTPMLLAGPAANEAAGRLAALQMNISVAGSVIGDASSIKMLRSVMIKGFEALTAECLLAARRAGVEEAVLDSLQLSDPGIDWRARGSYNLERMRHHGTRRAAEMREVAATLRDLGLPDRLAAATVEWQAQVGASGAGGDDLTTQLDSILEAIA